MQCYAIPFVWVHWAIDVSVTAVSPPDPYKCPSELQGAMPRHQQTRMRYQTSDELYWLLFRQEHIDGILSGHTQVENWVISNALQFTRPILSRQLTLTTVSNYDHKLVVQQLLHILCREDFLWHSGGPNIVSVPALAPPTISITTVWHDWQKKQNIRNSSHVIILSFSGEQSTFCKWELEFRTIQTILLNQECTDTTFINICGKCAIKHHLAESQAVALVLWCYTWLELWQKPPRCLVHGFCSNMHQQLVVLAYKVC